MHHVVRNYLLAFAVLAATTTAAHAQFDLEDSLTTASLRGIHSLGNGLAWASGTDGTVLRTEDGGYEWQPCTTPPGAEHLDFRGIQAFDENTAIVMSSGKGDLSRLYKTTDGCRTWKLVFTNPDKEGFFDAVSFDPPYKEANGQLRASGGVLGDPVSGTFPVFRSVDGGDNWSRRTATKRGSHGEGCRLDEFPAKNLEAAFAASNQSLFTSFQNLAFVTGGSISRLGYTDHFDLDFAFCHDSAKFIDLPLMHATPSAGAFAIAAIKGQGFFPLKVIVVGGDFQRPDVTQGNAVLIQSREGLHIPFTSYFDVITPTTPPHGYRSSVAYDPNTKVWITVGPNGSDYSTDDGKNWRPLHPGPNQPPDADKNWNALSLPFVVGPHGRIGKLRDDALKP